MAEPTVRVHTDAIDAAVPGVREQGGQALSIMQELLTEVGDIGDVFANPGEPAAKVFNESFWPNVDAVASALRSTGTGLHQVADNLHTYSKVYKATEDDNIEAIIAATRAGSDNGAHEPRPWTPRE